MVTICKMTSAHTSYAGGYHEFVTAMRSRRFRVRESKSFEAAPANMLVIAVSENYPLPGRSLGLAAQRERLRRLQGLYRGRLIELGLRDPYDSYQVSPDAYVSALGANRSNALAAADLLAGKIRSAGRLPVTPIKQIVLLQLRERLTTARSINKHTAI